MLKQDNFKLNCDGECSCKKNKEGYQAGLVYEGSPFYADGCGLPPIRPLIAENRRNKDKWEKFRAKKAAYDKCRSAKKEKKEEKKEERKEGKQKKGLHTLNKFNPVFVVARNSFLALVVLNYRNLAGNFSKMEGKSPKQWKKLSAKWFNLGGDLGALRNAIGKGKGKKPLFGVKKSADGMLNMTGAEVGVALTSAAGILAAVAPIIRAFKGETGEPMGDEIPTETGGVGADVPDEPDDDEPSGFVWTTGYIVGAVAVGLGIVGLVAWGMGAFKGGK